jgi:hypothetical protein
MLPTSPGFSSRVPSPIIRWSNHLTSSAFAVADAIEADFDLALHDLADYRHDPRRHLFAARLAARQAEGCLLQARRYGQPPDMAGTDPLRAVLHWPPPVATAAVLVRFPKATMIGMRSPRHQANA